MGLKKRNSSIEFLKIIAMVLIVISHVVQTYGVSHAEIGLSNQYFINIAISSNNFQNVLMSIFRYFGSIGNDIFFIISAWFLLDNKKNNYSKIVNMIIDILIFSVVFLVIFKAIGINIANADLFKSIFPIITAANWYITCYILFYIIHPGLNIVIDKLSQSQLLRFNILLILLYGVVCLLDSDLLFCTYLVQFIFIYFIIAYIKKYMNKMFSSVKVNITIFICSTIMLLLLILLTNYLGLKIPTFSNWILHWAKCNNILIILMAFSLFNIFKNRAFFNEPINNIAKQTLFIYIIHENILFRTYIRPYIFVFIYEKFGYSHIICWVLLVSVLLFVISSLISIIYSCTIQKITRKVSAYILEKMGKVSGKIEEKILSIE